MMNGTGKRVERIEAKLGNTTDRATRVSRRIARILNTRGLLVPEHRQALVQKVRPGPSPRGSAAAAIRGRRRTAEDNAARERDNSAWDAMSDDELLAWFQRAAKTAWDELGDDGRQGIVDGLAQVAALQAQPPPDAA